MKKKTNLIKYRSLSWAVMGGAVLGIFFLAFTPGCSAKTANRQEVMVEMPDPASMDFNGHQNIYYTDLVLKGIPEGFDPKEKIETFIFHDLSRTIDRKIEYWDEAKHGKTPAEGALLISGQLEVKIKSRSKIEEVKKEGKKKKSFVTVQHWEIEMTLAIKDISKNKEVLKKNFKARLANADAKTVEFNFENLFFRVTDQFLKRVHRTQKMQRRYILL